MTGLFFGSFNPIHNGHLNIARYILKQGFCEEIFFVVSPCNPLKVNTSLLNEYQRKELVESAIRNDAGMSVSDIEFGLPKPSYTIDTLKALRTLYPEKEFVLIIGEDNLRDFHLWKDYRQIYADYRILVYPRPGIDAQVSYPGICRIDAPLADISSTIIREKINKREDIRNDVPPLAYDKILEYYNGYSSNAYNNVDK